MYDRPYRPAAAGRPLSARELNRQAQDLRRAKVNFTGGHFSDEIGGQSVVDLSPPLETYIEILSGTNPYAWREVEFRDDTWQETGFRSGTTEVEPAYEVGGDDSVAASTVVLASFDVASGAWLFSVAPKTGFWARITSRTYTGGEWVYGFREVAYHEGGGDAVDKVDGEVGYAPASVEVLRTELGDVDNPERQMVYIAGPAFTGGTWSLGGATGLAHDISASALASALTSALGVTVGVTGSMTDGFDILWAADGARSMLSGSIGTLTPTAGSNYAHEANAWERARIGAIVWMRRRSSSTWQFEVSLGSATFDSLPGFDSDADMNVLTVDRFGALKIEQPSDCDGG